MKIITLITIFFISVLFASKNNTYSFNDTYYNSQWYIHYSKKFYTKNGIDRDAQIDTADILKKYSGKGVKIAIIDNGLNSLHEDLKGAHLSLYNQKKNYKIDDNHGTAVSGVIVAQANGKGIRGIAPDAEVLFLRYNKKMTPKHIVALFEKARRWGADIINCSWISIEVSKVVKKEIVKLATKARDNKGIIIVFAAGNGRQNNFLNESNIPEVVSVGATDKHNKIAWYSNYGKNLDIVAPAGNYIGIPALNGMNGKYLSYLKPNTFTGTSAAAAMVSGCIALMLEKKSTLSRIEVEDILKSTADKIGDKQYVNGRNDFYGYGKINLKNAMKKIIK